MASKKETTTEKNIRFLLYGIIASLIPYLCRLLILGINKVPDYYKSELDLFFFCIALCIAVAFEIRQKQIRFIAEIIGIFMFVIAIFVSISLSNECNLHVLNEEYLQYLKDKNVNVEETSNFVKKFAKLEETKDTLFYLSFLCSISALGGCYALIFRNK